MELTANETEAYLVGELTAYEAKAYLVVGPVKKEKRIKNRKRSFRHTSCTRILDNTRQDRTKITKRHTLNIDKTLNLPMPLK